MAGADKKGYVKPTAAGVLDLLMAPSAALAESKFLSLGFPALSLPALSWP